MFENVGFEHFFDGIGELHASVREKLYAIVVVRIVRGGNDDASLKIILANKTSDAGRSDNACKGYGRASFRQSRG
jgi:hypothetical protein